MLFFCFGCFSGAATWCLFEHNAVTSRTRERAFFFPLKGAWACVASENKAVNRHQQTGVMWNLRRPAALYCISQPGSHRLTLHTYLFSFFFFSLSLFHSNFCLKLLLLCLSPLFSLSLCLSRLSLSSAVPLWETIIDQLPSLSNWFPLSLRLSSPLSRRSPAVSSPLHSFQFAELHHFPQFLSFSLSLFFFLPFLTSLLSFTPSTLAQIPLYPLNWIHTRTKLECRHTHTALLPVRALSDPELDAQNLTLTAFAEFFRSP